MSAPGLWATLMGTTNGVPNMVPQDQETDAIVERDSGEPGGVQPVVMSSGEKFLEALQEMHRDLGYRSSY